MRNSYCKLVLVCLGVLLIFPVARAQDFQKSYKLPSGGSISVKNVSGDVSIRGYDGDVVIVNGFKEGHDRDRVEVVDSSAGNRVDVSVRYPRHCNCDASVRFEVRVPNSMTFNLENVSTASGNIEVTDIRGDVKVSTASGNVTITKVNGAINTSTASGEMRVRDVVGEVNAESASGDVEVEISQLQGTEDMKFSSASGDVHVKLPGNLDADVSMSTASGSIKTDFPIEVKERRYGPGSEARAQLGSSSRNVKLSTASGDVSLMRY